jgi:hypothetical protein
MTGHGFFLGLWEGAKPFGWALFDSEISLLQASNRLKLKGLGSGRLAGMRARSGLFRYFSALDGEPFRDFFCYKF